MTNFQPIMIKLADKTPCVVIQTTVGSQVPNAQCLHGGFNLGVHVNDDALAVYSHRNQLLSTLQQDYPQLARIHWLNQVHGEQVYHVTDALPISPVDADAHITTMSNTALAIMTADCVPVMISAQLPNGAPLIAAIHAGWQGIAKGIIAKTVQKMLHQVTMTNQDLSADETSALTGNWQAWIGACIAQDSYEVDNRVKTGVLASLPHGSGMAERLFRPNPEKLGHYFADLALAAELQLNRCGISQVYQSGLDSHSDTRFYSYRRQTQQQLATTGRMATLIFATS